MHGRLGTDDNPRNRTVLAKMAAAGNRPAGFDYMRLLLATAVIFHHSFTVTGTLEHGLAMWASPDRAVIGLILPMFFALSGFLVAGSLERNRSLVSFLGLRAIRLLPALAVEVFLSALILGPVLTFLPLRSYFSSPVFHRYFLNVLGNIHYQLPGVFARNPFGDTVNSQLWTIPFELKCYITLAAISFVGIAARRWVLLALLLLVQAGIVVLIVTGRIHADPTFPGKVLVGCFLAGVGLYRFRDLVPASPLLFSVSIVMTAVLLLVPYGYYFLSLPAAYATVYLGTLNPIRYRPILSGDYSYGLYLYGFPLQQAFISFGSWTYHWWLVFPIVYPAALAFAAFSWWCVEKPALNLKKQVMTCEGWALRVPPISWHSQRVFNAPARTPKAESRPASTGDNCSG